MKKVCIGNTGLVSSRIAFGTASLHHLRSARERERLVLTAFDSGITHFDTAPYYGYGIGERGLAALAGKGSAVTVATKVGLYPPGGADLPASLILPRKLLGKLLPPLAKPVADLSVARARESLNGSLRRMKREQVDLLLLHEPDYRLLATEEWLRWLETERNRVRAIGVAGEVPRVLPFVDGRSPFAAQIIQTRDSLASRESDALRRVGRVPQITFGHLARRDGTMPVPQMMKRTLESFPDTVLLLSTRRAERIAELARCADGA